MAHVGHTALNWTGEWREHQNEEEMSGNRSGIGWFQICTTKGLLFENLGLGNIGNEKGALPDSRARKKKAE